MAVLPEQVQSELKKQRFWCFLFFPFPRWIEIEIPATFIKHKPSFLSMEELLGELDPQGFPPVVGSGGHVGGPVGPDGGPGGPTGEVGAPVGRQAEHGDNHGGP